MVFGLGLFKNGPIIGRVVGDKDMLDTAYAIRYTTVNLGAFIGTFAVGILYKDVFAKDGVLGFDYAVFFFLLFRIFSTSLS